MDLNIKATALAFGVTWGAGLFLLTWWLIIFDIYTTDLTFIGEIYRGYNVSPSGSFIGFFWAFIDGGIGGAAFAWLYNRFARMFV